MRASPLFNQAQGAARHFISDFAFHSFSRKSRFPVTLRDRDTAGAAVRRHGEAARQPDSGIGKSRILLESDAGVTGHDTVAGLPPARTPRAPAH